ncbi:SIR2 family protein [Variovorax sp. J22P240]|uniref:SIR2 family NAD-dependent protein deacylase n=1 Tax=Variovorax sp. J22P240 TaxID=3053514 RepID=UPI0025789CDC|nr:SIR2 family protein [Variovorax sp. J22P240]MDM0002801.1 SIR2 family protein [Variovorax sp. J22P240]
MATSTALRTIASREPPFETIKAALEAGRVVPFVGAGASLAGRPEGESWTENAAYPPRGPELSSLLAQEAHFQDVSDDPRDREDLLKAAAYFEQQSGREELRIRLHQVLSRPHPLGRLHQYLAGLTNLRLIVTTNYDTLLERAFTAAGQQFDLVVHPKDSDEAGNSILWRRAGEDEPATILYEDLERMQIDLQATRVVFKMHGSVDERAQGELDNFIITEDDYIDFLSRMTTGTAVPKSFLRYFRGRSFLFLGYSLADWNLRVVLRNLGREFEAQSQRASRKHWAIQDRPSGIEQWLWQSRGVNVYDLRIDEFLDGLGAPGRGSGG